MHVNKSTFYRVASQILSSNFRVFKGCPGYFSEFSRVCVMKILWFLGYNAQNQGFSRVSHKKTYLTEDRKNTASLFKNVTILCFCFNLCCNHTNKLINK